MVSTSIRNVVMIFSVVAFCGALIGCSSSDDGRVADLERQLDMAEAAQMATEDQLAALRTQVETLMGRADISPEDLTALRTQVETLVGRADISPEDLAALRTQVETLMGRADTAEQILDDLPFNTAVVGAMEKIAVWGLNVDVDPESGDLENTSAWVRAREAYPDTGSESAALSQTHKYGDAIVFAAPWHGENGDLHFFVESPPAKGSLRDDIGVFTWRRLVTDLTHASNRDGTMVSHEPIEGHGLGARWQGFELTKAYDGKGAWTVHLFADLEESDVLVGPYSDFELTGFEGYEQAILLNDDRVYIPDGRDGLYIIIPEDGLQGSLDGVAGTFSCAEFYCTLVTDEDLSGYIPWIDSQVILFTPADGSQPEVMLDIPQLAAPSAEVPKVNYLTFGSWLYTPQDTTDVQAFDFGVFAGGGDPFVVTNLEGLTGTAEYAGKAAGTYAEILHPQTEAFTADVAFTADFDFRSENELGRMTGKVSNFNLESGKPSPLSALSLLSGWWGDGHVIGDASGSGDDNWRWRGTWGGKFFGNGAAATDLPMSFAGTFGAADGNHIVAGSFGSHKQQE